MSDTYMLALENTNARLQIRIAELEEIIKAMAGTLTERDQRIAELEADNKRLAKYAKGWHDGHKAGMERAAEIAKDNYKLPCFVDKDYMCYQAGSIAEAIRKEIDT